MATRSVSEVLEELGRTQDAALPPQDRSTLLQYVATNFDAAIEILHGDSAYPAVARHTIQAVFMHLAAEGGLVELVRALLDAGCSTEIKDPEGFTPLMRAAANGHEAVVRILLEAGADKDAKDPTGQTPMWAAAEYGHKAVLNALLEVLTDAEGLVVPFSALMDPSNSKTQVISIVLRSRELTQLPRSVQLSDFEALKGLILSKNQMESVPDDLVISCPALRYLDLSYNRLMQLPDSLGHLSCLRNLNVGHNPQLHLLPDSLGNCTQLRCCDVQHCGLIALPAAINRLESLCTLVASGNKFATLPSISGLKKLTYLDISRNPLLYPLYGELAAHHPQTLVKFFERDPSVGDLARLTVQRAAMNVLGNASSGKSSIVQSLIRKCPQVMRAEDATVGVEVYAWSPQPKATEDADDLWSSEAFHQNNYTWTANKTPSLQPSLEVTVLDCGGLPEYQPLAMTVMVPGSLILLVWDVSDSRWDDTASKDGEAWELLHTSILCFMESVYARHQTATFLLVGTKLDKIYRTSVAERRREFVWNNVRQRCGQKLDSTEGTKHMDVSDGISLNGLSILGCELVSAKNLAGIIRLEQSICRLLGNRTLGLVATRLHVECVMLEALVFQHRAFVESPFLTRSAFQELYRTLCSDIRSQEEFMEFHDAVEWLRSRFSIVVFDQSFHELSQYIFLKPQCLILALNALTRPLADSAATLAYKAKIQRAAQLMSTPRCVEEWTEMDGTVNRCSVALGNSFLTKRGTCEGCYRSFCTRHLPEGRRALLLETGSDLRWKLCNCCLESVLHAQDEAHRLEGRAEVSEWRLGSGAVRLLNDEGVLQTCLLPLLWRELHASAAVRQDLLCALQQARLLVPLITRPSVVNGSGDENRPLLVPWYLPAAMPPMVSMTWPAKTPDSMFHMGRIFLFKSMPVGLTTIMLGELCCLASEKRIQAMNQVYWAKGAFIEYSPNIETHPVLVEVCNAQETEATISICMREPKDLTHSQLLEAWDWLDSILATVRSIVMQAFPNIPPAIEWGFCPFCSNEFEYASAMPTTNMGDDGPCKLVPEYVCTQHGKDALPNGISSWDVVCRPAVPSSTAAIAAGSSIGSEQDVVDTEVQPSASLQ